MLDVNQEKSYKYQFFKSFNLTQRENRTPVYRLRGGSSYITSTPMRRES